MDETPPTSTKVTVKLSPRTMAALERVSARIELNKTDTINRSIQFYDYLVASAGGQDSITVLINGQPERLPI